MSKWVTVRAGRFGLPEYLGYLPIVLFGKGGGLRRSSVWAATIYRARAAGCSMSATRNALVGNPRESETIQHTLFECKAFEKEREVFLS